MKPRVSEQGQAQKMRDGTIMKFLIKWCVKMSVGDNITKRRVLREAGKKGNDMEEEVLRYQDVIRVRSVASMW